MSKKQDVDLKERFSYVQVINSGSMVIKRPYIYFSDIFAEMGRIEFDQLDSVKIMWDIKLE
jgi:hypothetical protein